MFDCAARANAFRALAFVSIGNDLRPLPPTLELGPYTYDPRGSPARRLALIPMPPSSTPPSTGQP